MGFIYWYLLYLELQQKSSTFLVLDSFIYTLNINVSVNINIFQKLWWYKYHCFIFFASIFNVWLNKRQRDSHICFCIGSGVISHIVKSLENSTAPSWENESEKGLLDSLRDFGDSQTFPRMAPVDLRVGRNIGQVLGNINYFLFLNVNNLSLGCCSKSLTS